MRKVRVQNLVSVVFVIWGLAAVPAIAKQRVTDVVPVEELTGQSLDNGQVTISGFMAAQVALRELTEKWKIAPQDYETVSVRDVGTSYHVLFTTAELHATYFGSPRLPSPILFRVDKKSFQILGYYQYGEDEH